jgi:hypothetical protein
MKLEKWALIAEVVSGVAIVVTLAILIFQIRQNTDAIRAANRQSVATRSQDWTLHVLSDPDSLAVFAALMNTSVDYRRENALVFTVIKLAEESFLQYRDGFLAEEYWQTRANFALNMLQTKGARTHYQDQVKRGVYIKAFTDWIDQALEQKSTTNEQGRPGPTDETKGVQVPH